MASGDATVLPRNCKPEERNRELTGLRRRIGRAVLIMIWLQMIVHLSPFNRGQ